MIIDRIAKVFEREHVCVWGIGPASQMANERRATGPTTFYLEHRAFSVLPSRFRGLSIGCRPTRRKRSGALRTSTIDG